MGLVGWERSFVLTSFGAVQAHKRLAIGQHYVPLMHHADHPPPIPVRDPPTDVAYLFPPP